MIRSGTELHVRVDCYEGDGGIMVPGILIASQNSACFQLVGPRFPRKRGHINMCGDFATKSLERTGQSAISIANQLALYLGGKPGHCAMFRTNAQPNSWCLVWAHGGRGNILRNVPADAGVIILSPKKNTKKASLVANFGGRTV